LNKASLTEHLPEIVSWVAFTGLAALLLVAAGQPILTDDAWLHLALGKAYAAAGPWLDADPLLANALGPPTPTAWLFDAGLFGIERWAGFTGLRAVHVAGVATILALAWWLLRRASGSRIFASLGCGLFAALAAYRLIQLRPHLFTLLAALALYWLLLESASPPSRKRIAGAALLFAAWANMHAAFLLGPLILGTALGGILVAMALGGAEARTRDRARATGLALAAGLGGAATLLNPSGLQPHLAWFIAGRETPDLARVGDEWSRVDLFAFPLPGLPPSPLNWLILWALVIALLFISTLALRAWRKRPRGTGPVASLDPALVAVSLLSLALPLIAVRFLWLGIFPLLLLARAGRPWTGEETQGRVAPWVGAVSSALLLAAFTNWGAGALISRTVPPTWAGYAEPYRAGKYHADLIWTLKDAGLQGTAFADYHMAGFMGFWLAPDIRVLVNGTLNVSQDVIAANLPLRERRGQREGETYTELLDRHGVDLFLGIRLPRAADSARPWFYTTGHLENTPGWIPIFRNLTGAIYLRTNEKNRKNLERVSEYYAELEIPFDASVGFDPERVTREKRGWAILHGLIPMHFTQITKAAYGSDPGLNFRGRGTLAAVYAALGLYERATALDLQRLEGDPHVIPVRRRLVWCLLRLGQINEAALYAAPLNETPTSDVLSRRIHDVALAAVGASAEERAGLIARLPVFSYVDASVLASGLAVPRPRTPPR
jgi:hypothetical protein